MSNINKRQLNKIIDNINELARFARLVAEGSDDDNANAQVGNLVRTVRENLSLWHVEFRSLYPPPIEPHTHYVNGSPEVCADESCVCNL